MHDVVAHAMVAINVQAGVGAHLLDRDPEQARRTLQDIKKLSGEALDDLRATLGTLRPPDDDEAAPVRPAQGLRELDDLGELGESLRSAGVEVDVDIDPATRTLPASVTTTGYRIVQEALTNVVRHASGSRAQVRVTQEDDRVVIDVRDDGRGVVPVGAAAAPGTGSGVRGMRERALAAGGTLEAGPLDGGGWRVLATLPLDRPGTAVVTDPRAAGRRPDAGARRASARCSSPRTTSRSSGRPSTASRRSRWPPRPGPTWC